MLARFMGTIPVDLVLVVVGMGVWKFSELKVGMLDGPDITS